MEMSAFVCKGEALFRANESLEGGFFLFFSGKVQSESIWSESKNGSFSKDKAHTEAVYILFDTVHYLAVQQTISIYNEPLLDNKRNARIYFKLLRNMRE